MSSSCYEFNGGQYVLLIDGKQTTVPADTIALAIDRAEGTLRKHGAPERVRSWHIENAKKLRQAGLDEWADNLVVVEGRFPLEEVNRCLSNHTYAGSLLRKLESGEIEGEGYGPEAPQPVVPQQI